MQSFVFFEREIVDIRRWLYTTIYAYNHTHTYVAKEIENRSCLENEVSLAFNEKGCNGESLVRRLSKDNIKVCKELALIRSISAFEVFLIDTIREVFDVDKSPFMKNGKYEVDYGFLLSCNDILVLQNRFIEKQCRTLHSGGLEEVKKYYKSTFGIDFNSFSCSFEGVTYGIEFIQQYHEMRHLIVHRLGKTDEHYRKTYNTNDSTVILYEKDLSLFFDVIIHFSNYLYRELSKHQLTKINENCAEITLEIVDDSDTQFIEPSFLFTKISEQRIPLSMILSGKEEIFKNIYKISLRGPEYSIRRYYKYLKKMQSAGKIKDLAYSQVVVSRRERRYKQFPWDETKKVLDLLPEKPWKKNIHKEIASQLGWSNNKVQRIINNVINEKDADVRLDAKKIALSVGESYTFATKVNPPEFANSITWSTENREIAEVERGTITAKKEGVTTVSAKVFGSSAKANCVVVVTDNNSQD